MKAVDIHYSYYTVIELDIRFLLLFGFIAIAAIVGIVLWRRRPKKPPPLP